ncbi:hypothetical protein DFQ27_000030 [Actinomortierella ambigua]|uniref:Uncharacterized protein n=1 Tax=Actinomortierella ambigua TaxID=1343610 RepID=A0A9P6QP88_9FUNG|nr:hypothetical protein DFQ27_000030 [Actinomortierella ambigua]
MGADWYSFATTTAAAIPVPKEALLQPFHLPGFKLMTVRQQSYDRELKVWFNEYHGALICLEDTMLPARWIEVIGPYEITRHQVECRRIRHLDAFMPAETRDRLVNAFETYTGRKPDVVPAFWAVSATRDYLVKLQSTWSLGEDGRIVGTEKCDKLHFSVVQDADVKDGDDSDA